MKGWFGDGNRDGASGASADRVKSAMPYLLVRQRTLIYITFEILPSSEGQRAFFRWRERSERRKVL